MKPMNKKQTKIEKLSEKLKILQGARDAAFPSLTDPKLSRYLVVLSIGNFNKKIKKVEDKLKALEWIFAGKTCEVCNDDVTYKCHNYNDHLFCSKKCVHAYQKTFMSDDEIHDNFPDATKVFYCGK